MKKILTVLASTAIAGMMLAGSFAPASATTAETATAMKGTPTIDGDLSDWADATQYNLSKTVAGNETISGWFKVKWDSGALYVAAQITDPSKDANSDFMEFLFNFDGVPTGSSSIPFASGTNAGIYSFNQAPWTPGGGDNPQNFLPPSDQSLAGTGIDVMGDDANHGDYKVSYTDGKYSVESKWVPATAALKAKLAAGTKIGLDVRYANSTTTIGWSSSNAVWGSDLRQIGEITLAEPVVINTPTAEAVGATPSVIDGNLNDWTSGTKYELSKTLSGTTAVSGWFKVWWDSSAIYIAAQITDPTNDTNSDMLKFLIDFDGVPAGAASVGFSSAAHAGVYALNMFPWLPGGMNAPQAWNPPSQNIADAGNQVLGDGTTECSISTKYVDGKYTIESKWVPANASLKAKLVEGANLGFDIRYIDHYSDATPNGNKTIGWASDSSWGNDLRLIGKLTLGKKSGEASVQPVAPTEGVADIHTPSDSDIGSDSVSIGWDNTDSATAYNVNIFKVTKQDGKDVYTYVSCDSSIAGTSDYIANLDPATQYAFQVLAFNASGDQIAAYKLLTVTTKSSGNDTGNSDDTSSESSGSPNTSDNGVALPVAILLFSAAACIGAKKFRK